jgi:Flp pilus assembly protein TadG
MVTAEIAVAMPVLMVLLAAALAAVTVIGGQLRCVDAAREAARALARGDSMDSARALATAAGPQGATLSSTTGPAQIRATVQARVRPIGGLLPAFTVSADAVALPEPTGAAP